MPSNISDLLSMDPSVRNHYVSKLKTTEIEELQADLGKKYYAGELKDIPPEKLESTGKCLYETKTQRENNQLKKFERRLPAILDDFLTEKFSSITTIHEGKEESKSIKSEKSFTPLGYAIVHNRMDIVEALFDTFSTTAFCENEPPHTFVKLIFGELTPDKPYAQGPIVDYVLDKLIETGRDFGRPFLFMDYLLSVNAGRASDATPQFQKNCLKLEPYKKQYSLIGSLPLDLQDMLEVCSIDYLNRLMGTEIKWDSASYYYIQGFMKSMMNAYIKDNPKPVQQFLEFFKKFMNWIPENQRAYYGRQLFDNKFIEAIVGFENVELFNFIKHYTSEKQVNECLNRCIPKIIRDAFGAKSKHAIDSLITVCGSSSVIGALLQDMKSDRSNFYTRHYYDIPKLFPAFDMEQLNELAKIIPEKKIISSMQPIHPFSHIIECKTELKFEIDDKTFGHIHNDHSLMGTTLEGSAMQQSLKQYLQFFSDTIANNAEGIGLTEEEKEKYLSFLKLEQIKMKNGLSLATMIDNFTIDIKRHSSQYGSYDWIRNNELYWRTILHELSIPILKEVRELKEGGQSLLIPGGWKKSHDEPGHTMLYELQRTAKGYVLLIHNSGEGLQFHALQQKEKGKYSSTLIALELSEDEFEKNKNRLLETLLKPQLLPVSDDSRSPEANYDANKLYYELLQNGEVIKNEVGLEKYKPGWTRGQQSGTCSERVFRSYFKSTCRKNNVNYEEFSLDRKYHALQNYYEIQKRNNRLNEGVVQRLIRSATPNLARHAEGVYRKAKASEIKSEEKKDSLSSAFIRREKTFRLIQSTEKSLESFHIEPEIKKDLPQYISRKHLVKPTLTDSSLEMPISLASELKVESSETVPCSLLSASRSFSFPNDEIVVFDKRNPLLSFQKMLGISQNNLKNGHVFFSIQGIEKFYRQLPLHSDIWNSLEDKTLTQCLSAIRSLNATYLASIATQNPVPFAEQAVTIYTGFFIGNDIANSYAKNKNMKDFLKIELGDFDELIKSAYFINPDPSNNARLKELMAYYSFLKREEKQEEKDDKNVFHEIIKNYPRVIEPILKIKKEKKEEDCYDYPLKKDQAYSPDLEAAEYYCKNYTELRSKFVQVESDVSIVVNLEKLKADAQSYKENLDSVDCSIDLLSEEHFINKCSEKLEKISIQKNYHTGTLMLSGKLDFSNRSNYSFTLKNGHLPISQPLYRTSLIEKPREINQIQVDTLRATLTEEIALQRTLLSTRNVKTMQIASTIDLLKKEFFRLQEPDFQQFIFLNLFHSDLFYQQIQENDLILKDFIDLIERGLKNYSRELRLQQPAFFILKLSQCLGILLNSFKEPLSSSPAIQEQTNRLSAINARLVDEIAYYEKLYFTDPREDIKNALQKLHEFNLIRIRNQIEKKTVDVNLLHQALFSWMARSNLSATYQSDPFMEYQAFQANAVIQSHLIKYYQNRESKEEKTPDETLIDILNKSLTYIGLKAPDLSYWKGKYPEFYLMQLNAEKKESFLYSINWVEGRIYQNDVRFMPLPPAVYNAILFKRFFQEIPPTCKASVDQTIFEFIVKGVTYRFNTKEKKLYREIEMNGIKKWYQFHEASGKSLSFDDRSPPLPLTLLEKNKTLWISLEEKKESQQTVIIDEKQQKAVCYYDKTGAYEVHDGRKTDFKLINIAPSSKVLFDRLSSLFAFEDISFIEFWMKESASPKNISIRLPRYGLTFDQKINPDGSLGDILWIESPEKKPRYKLNAKKSDLIPGLESILHFIPLEEEKAEDKKSEEKIDKEKLSEMVLIPKQSYILIPDEKKKPIKEEEYYKSVLDNSEKVKFFSTKGNHTFYAPGNHYYTHQEKYVTYKVLPSHELIPDNIDDKLYLAYLYLGRRQPLLAFQILKQVQQKMIHLNDDNVKWILNILHGPIRNGGLYEPMFDTADIYYTDKAKIDSPEFNAVRMLAASIVIEQRMQNPTLIRLPGISSLYEKYFRNMNKIPEMMRLDEKLEHNVLRHISSESYLPFHFKARRKQLSSRQMALEQRRLKNVADAKFPLAYQHRLHKLDKKLLRSRENKIIPEKPLLIEAKITPLSVPDVISGLTDNFKTLYKPLELKSEEKKIEKKEQSIEAILEDEIKNDYEVGIFLNNNIRLRKAATMELFTTLQPFKKENKGEIFPLATLSADIDTLIKGQKKEIEDLKEIILKLANELPAESDPRRIEWELDLAAQRRFPLNFEQILHLFLKQDEHFYEQKTALRGEKIKKLNDMIFQFLIKATKNQHDERLQSELLKLTKAKTSENYEFSINKIGQLLDTERCYKPHENPAMLVFEYMDNKLLFKQQFQYIQGFLKPDASGQGFCSKSVQLIMGGGKSKVLLPLLALLKAKGTNLSIIEVPSSLLQMNRADLSAINQKILGQNAQVFIFNESIDCTLEFLRNTRNRLRSAILNREYLLTVPESMQAFELKFIKFIESMNPHLPEDVKKAELFTEISRIFKYQSDAIIDEAHFVLDPKKQLIYTVDDGEGIPAHVLKAVYDIHQFFKEINIAESKRNESTLYDVLSGVYVPRSSDWPFLFERLAKELIENKKSPLQEVIHQLTKDKSARDVRIIEIELLAYLLSQTETIPSCITTLLPEKLKASKNPEDEIEKKKIMALQDKIATYKEEVSKIFPMTFLKNVSEHFGLSKDLTKAKMEREIAIPYIASNVPSETSRFGNYLETINYTLRIQLFKPLSKDVVETMVQHFKNIDEEEYKSIIPISGKRVEEQFYELMNKRFKLSEIEIKEEKAFNTFFDAVKDDPKIKEFCLLNHILSPIRMNETTLVSDPQNHCSQYRSIQLMTGTDYNYRCYLDSIETDKTVSLGSDGQTRDHLLRHPKPVRCLDAAFTTEQKIAEAIKLFSSQEEKDKLHAWIDVGAYFKGISNQVVADHLTKYFSTNTDFAPIKYVLYFGEDDRLYAKSTEEKNASPIWLEQTSADFIEKKLGYPPANTFTYYDQRHTIGTDITQDVTAHAFISLGLTTMDQEWLQATMRMRGLGDQQRLIYVIPKEVQVANPQIITWNAHAVDQYCRRNRINRLIDDHFRAGVQKIKNILRNDLHSRLLEATPVEQKKLIAIFKEIFFTSSKKTVFEQFSAVSVMVDTGLSLRSLSKDVFEKWIELTSKAGFSLSLKEKEEMKITLDNHVNQSILICSKKVEQLKSTFALQDSRVEVSKQKTVTNEVNLNKSVEYRTDYGALPLYSMAILEIKFSETTFAKDKLYGGVLIDSLEKMSKNPDTPSRSWMFSDNIFVTENYKNTCQRSFTTMNGYKKEATFFLVEQTDKPPRQIKFLLITNEEAAALSEQLKEAKFENKKLWIESVHNTIKTGTKPPASMLHPAYQDRVEQIAFFNGDSDVLYNQFKPGSWLASDFSNKMDYFKNVIQPVHKDKVDMIKPLENVFKENAFLAETKEEKKEVKATVPVLTMSEFVQISKASAAQTSSLLGVRLSKVAQTAFLSMGQTKNDEERYQMAKAFVTYHGEDPFSKILMKMVPSLANFFENPVIKILKELNTEVTNDKDKILIISLMTIVSDLNRAGEASLLSRFSNEIIKSSKTKTPLKDMLDKCSPDDKGVLYNILNKIPEKNISLKNLKQMSLANLSQGFYWPLKKNKRFF